MIGFKRGTTEVVKVAAHEYLEGEDALGFMEIEGAVLKEVKLTLSTKTATLSHFGMRDLQDGTVFTCAY